MRMFEGKNNNKKWIREVLEFLCHGLANTISLWEYNSFTGKGGGGWESSRMRSGSLV